MKSRFPLQTFAPAALFLAASIALVSCAGKQNSTESTPVAPGTVQPSGGGATSGEGSYQGPITNANGVIQAILTMDVWTKAGQTNAQLTLSPNGASALVPLNAGSQSFSVELPSAQFKTKVTVQGTWNGSSWAGQITSEQNTSNSFSLAQGASQNAAVSIGAPTGTFEGKLTYKGSGGTRGLALTLTPSKDLGDALASTLATRVSLAGTLKFSNGQVEPLKNVVWDRENSTLSADGTFPGPGGVSIVRCKMSEMNSDDKDVLACAFTTAKSNSPVATGPLSQKRAVVAPPYQGPPVQPNPIPQPNPPAPTPYLPPDPQPTAAPTAPPVPAPTAIPAPVPTPAFFEKTVRNYDGTGVFKNAAGKTQTRNLTLVVRLIEQPTGAQQKANISFIIDDSRVGANFITGSYNSASGALSAEQVMTLGVLAGADLECRGVQFANPTYDFVCHYESYATNVSGEFHLKGAGQ